MDEHQQALAGYITRQLQVGQTPNEISAQLEAAGWPVDQIHQAFLSVQNQVLPTAMQQPQPSQDAEQNNTQSPAQSQSPNQQPPQAFGTRRGRIRNGWVLLKQSMKILNGNRYLLRYLYMTWAVIMAVEAVLCLISYFGDRSFSHADGSDNALWYVFSFVSYVIIYCIINFYATALARNIFDIFDGQRQPYSTYLKLTRDKAGPIFVFSVIDAIVGMFLRYVVERVRWVGWILSWLLGTIWSLGTMFVLPLIADTELSATQSIKESIRLFKKTWGENIVAKVTVNAPLGLITLLLAFVYWPIFWWSLISGNFVLFWFLLITYIFLQLTIAIIGSFANSTINVALYYYAVKRQVPPGFTSDMLNQVFIPRKRNALLQKLKPSAE